MLRRELIKALAVAAVVWPLAAQPQSYPSRPIVMVVPYAAGGTFDVMGRILATRMSEFLGQPVIVENTTGRNPIPRGRSSWWCLMPPAPRAARPPPRQPVP
jgi:hypothetical protein